jgi:TRAP-type C4-dicarboxylate transport system permease small subunit
VTALLQRLERAGRLIEDSLLSILLLSMIALAVGQIIGRNVFSTTFVLGDELLRLMVLWLTLAGALAASRADRHIAIAVLDRFLDGRVLDFTRAFLHLFTAFICALLCWYSLAFVLGSKEYGDQLLGDLPAWVLQAPLPAGFGLMAWRHLLHAIMHAQGRAPEPEPA